MEDKSDTPDVRIAEIAARQHGVVTLRQLEGAGLGRRGASKRVAKGQLHRLHRGVYAVGHSAPSHHRRWIAAVLACGEGAVLSHHCAAALWELLRPIDGPVHVSVPSASGLKKRRGICVHRCPSLGTPTTHRHNIPVTTIHRTIEDLEGTIAPYLLRRAKRQAELKGVHLQGVESKRQRSDLEEDFLTLFLADHLPHPETNLKIGRHEVDFLWRDQRVIVEADTFLYHRGSVAFENDHARDLDLRQRGYTVLRFTDRQLEEEPERVVAVVREALS